MLDVPVSDYQQRKAAAVDAGCCIYPGCELAPADDSDYCPAHRDEKRARNRRYKRARRRRWAQQRRCLDCGGRRKLGRKRCAACLIKRDRLRSGGGDKVVDKTPKTKLEIRVEADGWTRTRERYVGQGKRGPQSKAALDDQDLDDAIARLQRAKAALQVASSPEVAELPLAQRQETKAAALAQVVHGIRFGIAVLHRHRIDVSEIVANVEESDT